SASLVLITATVVLAWFSSSVKDRPGAMSPPATLGHADDRPSMRTLDCFLLPKLTSAFDPSSTATHATAGMASIVCASSTERGGFRRHGLISSDPSDTTTPAWKNRVTKNVVGPVRAS